MSDPKLSALLEAIIYLAEEPVRIGQITRALKDSSRKEVMAGIGELIDKYQAPEHGVEIREIAGGYLFSTKAEHHEILKRFAKSLVPPTRLSLPALETLAVIAYRQPVTVPEIQEIRGVQASGVIKTLLDRNLVTVAGRKEVIGRPILYKTTREFLIHFGLKRLDELPSVEEFEELIKTEHSAQQAALPLDEPEGDQTGDPETITEGSDTAPEA